MYAVYGETNKDRNDFGKESIQKENHMTRTEKEIVQRLQLEKQVLSAQLQRKNNSGSTEPVSFVEGQIRTRLRERLASIERALDRLEDGTFGVCQSCGGEIDAERLIALPYAEQCISCQRSFERRIIRPQVYSYLAC